MGNPSPDWKHPLCVYLCGFNWTLPILFSLHVIVSTHLTHIFPSSHHLNIVTVHHLNNGHIHTPMRSWTWKVITLDYHRSSDTKLAARPMHVVAPWPSVTLHRKPEEIWVEQSFAIGLIYLPFIDLASVGKEIYLVTKKYIQTRYIIGNN